MPKLFEEIVLFFCEDEQSLMNLVGLLLLPCLHDLVQAGNQLVKAQFAELSHVIPQGVSENAPIYVLGGFFDSGVGSSDDVVGTGIQLSYECRSTELVMLKVLSLQPYIYWKDKFFLVSPENHPCSLFQQLYPSFIDKVRQKLGVIFAEKSRHEQVYVKTYHVLFAIAKKVRNSLSNFFDPTTLFNKVNIYDSLLFYKCFTICLLHQSLLHQLLPSKFFELILPRAVDLEHVVEHKQSQSKWPVISHLPNQFFKLFLNAALDLE